ncbi:hypothetical protein BVY04_04080, partial [bacterium M21]
RIILEIRAFKRRLPRWYRFIHGALHQQLAKSHALISWSSIRLPQDFMARNVKNMDDQLEIRGLTATWADKRIGEY